MKGRKPKPPGMAQRRNRSTTAAVLETVEPAIDGVPELGECPVEDEWHDRTRDWWQSVWSSPMRDEFIEVDVHGLRLVAALVETFWRRPSTKMAAEIRLQEARFGLSPMDRRRLQWTIVRAEKADGRRGVKPPQEASDPRNVLKVVR